MSDDHVGNLSLAVGGCVGWGSLVVKRDIYKKPRYCWKNYGVVVEIASARSAKVLTVHGDEVSVQQNKLHTLTHDVWVELEKRGLLK